LDINFKGDNMNKLEIIKVVADEVGLTQKEVASVVDTMLATIIRELQKGEEVNIAGFGKFVVKNRAARTSINPRTHEPINVPASKAPAFKAGKQFKESVNK
jgi:DNA-binding protein HU-beta